MSPTGLYFSSSGRASQKNIVEAEAVSAISKYVEDVLSALEQAQKIFDGCNGHDEAEFFSEVS